MKTPIPITYTAKEMLSITRECKKRAYAKGYRAGKKASIDSVLLRMREARQTGLEDEFEARKANAEREYKARQIGQTGLERKMKKAFGDPKIWREGQTEKKC